MFGRPYLLIYCYHQRPFFIMLKDTQSTKRVGSGWIRTQVACALYYFLAEVLSADYRHHRRLDDFYSSSAQRTQTDTPACYLLCLHRLASSEDLCSMLATFILAKRRSASLGVMPDTQWRQLLFLVSVSALCWTLAMS